MAKNINTRGLHPPKLADRFLQWYCHPSLLEEIQGDLYENFSKNVQILGLKKARWIYFLLVLKFLRPSNIRNTHPKFSIIMWRNYLKTALRSMVKQKGFTFMNILGLTIGLTTALMILLWIQDEVSYDHFHDNGANLYSMKRNVYRDGGQIGTTSSIPKPLEAELESNYPEIESADLFSWEENFVLTHENTSFRANGHYVGETFFRNFTFPFIAGNPETALIDRNSIVISDRMARRLFGPSWEQDGNVIGKVIQVGIETFRNMTLQGVYEDMPSNSSLNFEFAISDKLYLQENEWVENWGNNGFHMFIKTRPDVDINELNTKIKDIINNHIPDEKVELFAQAYLDHHLYSDYENGQVVGGRIEYVRIFSFVAIFIMLIAAINYMSMATARSSVRAKEVGIRKTIGARKSDLVSQFIGESTITTAISLILAILVSVLLLPTFNNLTNKAVRIDWGNPTVWLSLLGLLFVVGLFSGLYPAFFLSSSPINKILKGSKTSKSGFSNMRRGLVVLQFVLSTFLIIGTYTCYQQIQYIKNKNLGFNKENVVYFPLEGELIQKYETFKERALKHESILKMTACVDPPTAIVRGTSGVIWDGRDPSADIEMAVAITDYDYVETLKMELLAGRLHSKEYKLDSANLVINEAAARIMGMQDPVGENIRMWGREGKIIGMVQDFHFSTMYDPIEPLVIRLDNLRSGSIFARLSSEQMEEGIGFLEDIHKEMNPDFPFTYDFLDENYAASYTSENIVATLASYFAIIAILISCLGLFGLALFAAERRYKEISIRKVLGASIPNIMVLLSKEFLILVFIAILIAIPIAWYGTRIWLDDFAYRISLGVEIFIFSGLLTLGVALITVCFEAFRAALHNPVDALKSE